MPVYGRIQRCLPQSFRQSKTHLSLIARMAFFGPGRPKTCSDRLLHMYLLDPVAATGSAAHHHADVPIKTCDPPLSLLWIFIVPFCENLFGWTWSARGKRGLDWKGGKGLGGVYVCVPMLIFLCSKGFGKMTEKKKEERGKRKKEGGGAVECASI